MGSEEFWPAEEALLDRLIAGKFRLRRCIGAGSSGAVYQADQISLGRTVAVKILRQELAEDPRLCARFQDEALAASRLNHPNTIAVIDYGQTEDGLLYLVMEFLRGKTLTQLMQETFPLPETRAADIVSQILLGIEEAHGAGVVHADLKADNIVVEERRADWDLVKVVDFGIARLLGGPRDAAEQAEEEKFICGTPEYMAPEVIGGAEPTFAADLYAVGVIIYELLCGITPFAGGTSLDVLTRHLRDAPIAPSERFPDLPVSGPLEEVALRALAKDPGDRFASAREFREALAEAVAPRRATRASEVVCAACGVPSAASFKFCPECGSPRDAAFPAGAGGTAQVTDPRTPTVNIAGREDTIVRGGPALTDRRGALFPLPLVDRDDAIADLERFLEPAPMEPSPRLCTVVGPPGSGRSRLIRELCRRMAESGADTLIYLATPDPTGLASPFYPIRSLVAGILALPPFCSHESLAAAMATAGLSPRDLTGITELFGNAGEISELEASVRRRELYASTLRALRSAGPAVFVFEDANQYDAPSQELLRRLIESSGEDDLRVIVTGGAEIADRLPGGLRIDLAPLSPEGARALADYLASGTGELAADPGDLVAHASNSPGAFDQLARYLVEGGSIASAPPGIADLIAARMEMLPRPALLVAQAAASLGCAAAEEDVRAAAHSRVNGAAFDEAAQTLEAHGVISREERMWRFERDLIRDVIYEATPADARRSLHAAAFLSIAGGADEAVLGHHAELAGRDRDAAELLSKGGDAFVHQLDDGGASRLFHGALSAARRVMLAETDNSSRALFVSISVKLADTLRITGQPGLARGIIDEAFDYCQDAPLLKAQLLRASAHLAAAQGNFERATELARRAIGLGITAGRRELLVELYLDTATFHAGSGHADGAITELEEGIDLITLGAGVNANDAPKPFWQMLLRLGKLCGARGDRERAIALAKAAHAQALRAGSKLGSARSQSLLAAQFDELGDETLAAKYRRLAVEQLRRIGDRRGTAELLLAGKGGTLRIRRVNPESLEEARELAAEVGWVEALERIGAANPA